MTHADLLRRFALALGVFAFSSVAGAESNYKADYAKLKRDVPTAKRDAYLAA